MVTMRTRIRPVAGLLVAVALAGCQSIGPDSVQRDRIDYAGALGNSWKEQTLLNIVKLRYLDTPVYLDVTSVVSMYEMAGQASLSSTIFPRSSVDTNYGVGVTGRYTEWPTISYAPLAGERYINSLLRPIPPKTVLAMVDAGHPADFILQATARAINGVYNRSTRPFRPQDPVFTEVVAALRRVQLAGALSVRIEKRGDEETTKILFRRDVSEDSESDIRWLKNTLKINPASDEFLVTAGALRRGGEEIELLTRSMQEILRILSAGVQVPEEDLSAGRATPLWGLTPGEGEPVYPAVQIRSGAEQPGDAYAAARYRNRWFWIDDRDLESKRVFMFLMIFSSLAETGAAVQTPLIVRSPR
jgi:hypothetical protein